jgi:arsenite methyltransferase
MTAGIAPLVSRVVLVDGSQAMLDVARKNLQGFDNLDFRQADGLALPLEDGSLDAVFANMYLHHCADPLAAIKELTRVLQPGGRLIIMDMDIHPYTWMMEEMADAWPGFERDQMRQWYRQAGLVNVIVDCTGESCCAQSQDENLAEQPAGQARISIFVAVGAKRTPGVKEAVQASYGAAARGERSCCASPVESANLNAGNPASCCGGEDTTPFISLEMVENPQLQIGYRPEDLAQAPTEAVEISLGCGNPLALSELQAGETVVDIGSGGGIDAILAARRVGPSGHVIGVDMTEDMLNRARRTIQKTGLEQVEFRRGQAEALPVEDATVDVIISNCVINLSEDKGQVFREAARVLKPGGRLSVSDVVTSRPFPSELRANAADWAGCVYGALPEQEYLDLMAEAGFSEVQVQRSPSAEAAPGVQVYSINVTARRTTV